MKSTLSIIFDKEGVFDLGTDNKLQYTQIYTPIKGKIKKGSRNNVLSAIIKTLLALNKTILRKNIENAIFAINNGKMETPLPTEEVMRIIDRTYDMIDEIELLPNATKRFFFDESLQLTKEQKQSLVAKRINKGRVLKSQAIIREMLENWEKEEMGKPTHKNIVRATGLSKNTVTKYYKEIKKELGIE